MQSLAIFLNTVVYSEVRYGDAGERNLRKNIVNIIINKKTITSISTTKIQLLKRQIITSTIVLSCTPTFKNSNSTLNRQGLGSASVMTVCCQSNLCNN